MTDNRKALIEIVEDMIEFMQLAFGEERLELDNHISTYYDIKKDLKDGQVSISKCARILSIQYSKHGISLRAVYTTYDEYKIYKFEPGHDGTRFSIHKLFIYQPDPNSTRKLIDVDVYFNRSLIHELPTYDMYLVMDDISKLLPPNFNAIVKIPNDFTKFNKEEL